MSYRRKRMKSVRHEALESERSDTSAASYSTSPRPNHVIQPKGRSLTPTSTTPHNLLPLNLVNGSVEGRPCRKPRTSRNRPPHFRSSQKHESSHLRSNTHFSSRPSSHQNDSSTSLGSGELKASLSGNRSIAKHSASAADMDAQMVDEPVREANSAPLEIEIEQVTEGASKPSKSSNLKLKSVVLNWPDHLGFDEKEEVLTIDTEGKQMLLAGRIQTHDIDNLEVGVRCVVQFNEFNQPVRKGGSILAKYLGSLAKNKGFCPIGEKSWHYINKQYKAKIIQVVRSKFVIPEGETFNRAILMRVSKHWREYKHNLKKAKFDPKTRTKNEIFNDVPHGQTRESWIHLVEYWYSQESQKLSEYGKKARASKNHVHTTGGTSYANKRADFVESNGRQPSQIEFFKLTHTQNGVGSDDNAISSQFLAEANAKIQEFVKNASSSKSRVEIENDVFHSLIYEDGHHKKPIGFGLGVKESDIFGVHSLLRKTSHCSTIGTNSSMEVENLKATIANMKKENQVALANMKKENQDLRDRVDQTNLILLQALNAIRTGVVSSEFLDAVESTLRGVDSQVVSESSDDMCEQ